MSQQFRLEAMGQYGQYSAGISEPESYIEHQAALEATIFRPDASDASDASELILELEAGELRVRTRD